MEEAILRIEDFIRSGKPHQIVPINAAKLWRMQYDHRLAHIVLNAELVVPEKAIVLGSRLLGTPLKAHIGGVMLLKALLPVAENHGYRVYFLGARPYVVERMVKKLRQEYKRLKVAGWHHGYFGAETNPQIVTHIRNAAPDLLFVAMGTPKQEYWIADHLRVLNVPVCMGVGGSFDVLAGLKKDAPQWVRTLYLEWLYRLVQDPGNLWRRYLTTMPWFAYQVARRWVRR